MGTSVVLLRNTMRIPVLASLLGLSLVACAGNISGGGGDDDIPETCGNGAVDPGEDCDGTEGCSATCTTEAVPRLAVTVDRTRVDTELAKTEVIKATFTSEGGFTGTANVAVSVVDTANAAIPLVIPGGPTTVSLTAGQSLTVDYPIGIASNATSAALEGTWKLDVTSDANPVNLTSTIAITPNITLAYKAGTGADPSKHPVQSAEIPSTLTIKRGATISYRNDDTVPHVTHGGGGLPHESTAVDGNNQPIAGQPNQTYVVQTLPVSPTNNATFGCHLHGGDASYVTFTIE